MAQKKLKVLHITAGFAIEGPLGGIEKFGVELVRRQKRNGLVEPIICGLWSFGTPYEQKWIDDLQAEGIHAFMTGPYAADSVYQTLQTAIHHLRTIDLEVDIIHNHCTFGDVIALFAARRLGAKKLIRTVHNEVEWVKHPILGRIFLTNLLYPFVFQLETAVSKVAVQNLDRRPLARLLRKQALLTYNAINYEDVQRRVLHEAIREPIPFRPNARLIGTVGRLAPQKGHSILLRAVAILVAQGIDLQCVIVGDGKLGDELRELSAELNLENHIIFTGARSDVIGIVKRLELFVSSSLWEGLPTTMMECAIARVPMVTTDVGGSTEIVKHQMGGWVVDENDPNALAHGIHHMLQLDKSELELITQFTHDHVKAHYTINSTAQILENAYLNG